jgi:hypothetical protein
MPFYVPSAVHRNPAAMKIFLLATAAIELGAGAVLLCSPAVAVNLLLASPPGGAAAVTLGRVAGAALLALGIACWLARGDANGRAARGLIVAMLIYNAAVAAILAFAGISLKLAGVLLWPAVALHAVMATWCVACQRNRSTAATK